MLLSIYGSYEYLGNAAASINLKKTLTFTSPHHLSGEFSWPESPFEFALRPALLSVQARQTISIVCFQFFDIL